MEPQKQGNSPGPGPEVVDYRKTESRQKVCSWTVQNEMKGVHRHCEKNS